MGNETDQPDTAGADAARAAARAILLQRQNLLQIQKSLRALRGRLGGQAYAAWVAAEFPGLPDPAMLTAEEFLELLCCATPALAALLTDPAELAELERLAYGL